MFNLSLKILLENLYRKKINYFDLTIYFLDRIKKFDFLLNSFITVDYYFSLQIARCLDYLRTKNHYSSFSFGVPFAQKDNFCSKGLQTTCGSRMLRSFIPSYDSIILSKLKKNNFILVGKTNMDEFSMGSSGENSFFGPTRNPWNLSRTPGGSSSGSAAAVAARLIPFTIGSDTGGSIRQPAAFCGIVGLKPTYGVLSRYGLISFASNLDQAGILCKTVDDCFIIFQNLISQPICDLTGSCSEAFLAKNISVHSNVCIGVLKESYSEGVSNDVVAALNSSIAVLKTLGFRIKIISISSFFFIFTCLLCFFFHRIIFKFVAVRWF